MRKSKLIKVKKFTQDPKAGKRWSAVKAVEYTHTESLPPYR